MAFLSQSDHQIQTKGASSLNASLVIAARYSTISKVSWAIAFNDSSIWFSRQPWSWWWQLSVFVTIGIGIRKLNPTNYRYSQIVEKSLSCPTLPLIIGKICTYFLPIHHRSATIDFWKMHKKSRQKLSTDFVTLKNGDTPTYSYEVTLPVVLRTYVLYYAYGCTFLLRSGLTFDSALQPLWRDYKVASLVVSLSRRTRCIFVLLTCSCMKRQFSEQLYLPEV